MSVDRFYQVKIALVADNSGAREASREMGKVGEATKTAREHAELFNFHGRETHKLLGMIERQSGLAATALKVFLEPEAVGVGLLIVALETVVELVKRSAEETKKAAEQWRESYVEYTAAASEAANKTRELHEANEQFWKDARRHREEESEKNSFTASLEAIKEGIENQKKILEAQKQLELESVNTAEASGKMSPTQAAARRSQIEGAYRDIERGVDQGGQQSLIDERTKQVRQLNEEIETAKIRNAQANSPHAEERQGTLSAAINSLNEYVKSLGAAFNNQTSLGPSRVYAGPKNAVGVEEGAFNYEEYSERVAEANKAIAKMTGELGDIQTESKNAREDLNNKTNQRNQLQDENAAAENRMSRTADATTQIAALNNLADQIKQLTQLGILGHTVTTPVPFRPGQNTYNNPLAESIFSQGVSALTAQQALRPGQQISEQQKQQIDALNNLVAALGWPPQIIARINNMITLHQSTAGMVKAMDTRIEQLEATVRSTTSLNHR